MRRSQGKEKTIGGEGRSKRKRGGGREETREREDKRSEGGEEVPHHS